MSQSATEMAQEAQLMESAAMYAAQAALTEATTDVKIPLFDVVSVKPNKSDNGMMRIMFNADGYSATNVSPKMLIQVAYGIRQDLISGGPGWVDSARYDFDAKVAGPDVDALKKLTTERVDLVITDINMPMMDGLKLIAVIRSNARTKTLPIIIVTTEGAEEDRKRGLALGANAYIPKPIQPSELLKTIASLLENARG